MEMQNQALIGAPTAVSQTANSGDITFRDLAAAYQFAYDGRPGVAWAGTFCTAA